MKYITQVKILKGIRIRDVFFFTRKSNKKISRKIIFCGKIQYLVRHSIAIAIHDIKDGDTVVVKFTRHFDDKTNKLSKIRRVIKIKKIERA